MKLLKRFLALASAAIIAVTPLMANDYTGHWAQAAIEKWKNRGVIGGFEDGTFRPNEPITRAQFAKIMVDLLGYTKTGNGKAYSDVEASAWYANAVEIISSAGIMYETDGYFYPNSPITREETAYALVNAFHLTDNSTTPSSFGDSNELASWAVSAVNTFHHLGYMNGKTANTINPKDNLTRAEFVVLLDRLDQDGKVYKTTSTITPPTTITNTTTNNTNNTNKTTTTKKSSTTKKSTTKKSTRTTHRRSYYNYDYGSISGELILRDSNGNYVRFPNHYDVQLGLYLYDSRLVADYRDFNFNYNNHTYHIYDDYDLVSGQTYRIKATVRNLDNSREVFYADQTVTWPYDRNKTVDIVLRSDVPIVPPPYDRPIPPPNDPNSPPPPPPNDSNLPPLPPPNDPNTPPPTTPPNDPNTPPPTTPPNDPNTPPLTTPPNDPNTPSPTTPPNDPNTPPPTTPPNDPNLPPLPPPNDPNTPPPKPNPSITIKPRSEDETAQSQSNESSQSQSTEDTNKTGLTISTHSNEVTQPQTKETAQSQTNETSEPQTNNTSQPQPSENSDNQNNSIKFTVDESSTKS